MESGFYSKLWKLGIFKQKHIYKFKENVKRISPSHPINNFISFSLDWIHREGHSVNDL
jgi:hypothetical protein